jgi:hypothetical protein
MNWDCGHRLSSLNGPGQKRRGMATLLGTALQINGSRGSQESEGTMAAEEGFCRVFQVVAIDGLKGSDVVGGSDRMY